MMQAPCLLLRADNKAEVSRAQHHAGRRLQLAAPARSPRRLIRMIKSATLAHFGHRVRISHAGEFAPGASCRVLIPSLKAYDLGSLEEAHMPANADSHPIHMAANDVADQPTARLRLTLARYQEALGQSIRGGERATDAPHSRASSAWWS